MKNKRILWFVLSISLISFVISAVLIKPLSVYAQTNANLSVAFAVERSQTKSISGFLPAMDANQPSDNLIAPLKPKLWRAGTLSNEIYPRAVNLG